MTQDDAYANAKKVVQARRGIGLVINAIAVFTGLTPGSEAEERAIRRYLEAHPS